MSNNKKSSPVIHIGVPVPLPFSARPAVSRVFLPAMLALATAGCAYMPFSTIYRLKSFDLGAFDPAALRIAIRIHEAIERRPGAVVHIETRAEGKETPQEVVDVALESVTQPAELAPLAAMAQEGEKLFLYRIAPKDVARVRKLQEDGKARTQAGVKTQVEIKPEPKGCLAQPLPPGPLYADLIARIEPNEPYFTVLRRVELRGELANRGVDLAEHLPPC